MTAITNGRHHDPLVAALSVLHRTVIGRRMSAIAIRGIHSFLNAAEREVAAGKLIRVVLGNYAMHKHPKVLAWPSLHPRSAFHFTPTSASWFNAVENFFSKMTCRRIRRGGLPLDPRPAGRHQCAYLAEHNASQTVRLDQIRRRYSGQTRPPSCTISLIECTRI
jgi:hypothetical protein